MALVTITNYSATNLGDGLLKHIATFLLGLRSENVVIGHMAADNFVLLIPKSDFKKENFLPLKDVLNAYNKDFSYAVSIGLASVNCHVSDIRSVLEEARLANRTLKNRRGVSFAIYNKALSRSVLINQSIVPLLREGMHNHEFIPYYQPIVDSKTGKMVMAEALVRWISPTHGFMSPGEFIPILEKNGFIGELDYYIRDQVCSFIKKMSGEGKAFPISVNISRIELENPDFVDVLVKQVDGFGIDHSLLRLEITETTVMEHVQQSMRNVRDLKKEGFLLEMDDFGSGFSSLSVLRDLPFKILKLDLRFFIGKHTKKGSAIIKAIASLAKTINLSIIAEGVEIQAQEDFLSEVGIHYIQGYLHSKPLPEEKLLEFYKEK
jgi:EAL domain-containing protein (putative c-di-GMP-specific phosphodiesterase class I)